MSIQGRRWLELKVRCPSAGDRSELLADALLELGCRGVEERDGWYTSYFAEPEDLDAFLVRARTTLAAETGLESISVSHGWQDHEEWAETWKRGLDQRRITDRIVVRPSWIEPRDLREDDIVIVVDPGMAFGTAEHGTTRGCLRLLDGAVVPGDRLLDVGSGSGILAIAAVRLGAAEVVAIEGDALACEALAENVEKNEVGKRVRMVQAWASGESLCEFGPVSGIIANIESGLLSPLFEGFFRAISPAGWLLVSGILDHEWESIERTLRLAGFRLNRVDEDGEWRSGLFDRVEE